MSQEKFVAKITAHIKFNNFYPHKKKILPIEIMWKNMIEPDRPQMTIKYNACALYAA
jgi:hypothetical protein